VTSPFGPRWGRLHAGIDLGAPTGTPTTASEAGRVSFLWHAPGGGYGNYLCIQHAARLSTCYAHLNRFAGGIRAGATVRRGELIGYVGNTGASHGAHLHYEVRLGAAYPAVAVDPLPYLLR
jgi:murein DD-endopeptidase MepM/ murein hydrolase activator NlpD